MYNFYYTHMRTHAARRFTWMIEESCKRLHHYHREAYKDIKKNISNIFTQFYVKVLHSFRRRRRHLYLTSRALYYLFIPLGRGQLTTYLSSCKKKWINAAYTNGNYLTFCRAAANKTCCMCKKKTHQWKKK